MRLIITLCCTILLGILFNAPKLHAEKLNVIYPNVNALGTTSFAYQLLELALEKSGYDYSLTMLDTVMTYPRKRLFINEGIINIADFGTSPKFEEDFLPIYFPIDMGLNGWRILLVHTDNKANFRKINNVDELSHYRAGQGDGWSDAEILSCAGLRVEKAPQIINLVQMIEHKRVDYFPLGVNEAHLLLEEHKNSAPNVVVDDRLLLIYPFARFFFVRKDNVVLRDAVYKGLIKAYEDGSFMKLFKSHPANQALFQLAKLQGRTIIEIPNEYLTENFLNIPKEYFFNMNTLSEK